jgi:cytochrome P450
VYNDSSTILIISSTSYVPILAGSLTVAQAVAAQLVQAQNLTKHSVLAKFTGHLTGKLSLLTSEGALWRKTRSIFNPGFAQQHLMTLVPRMIDDALHFRQNLEQASSSGEMFFLENFAAMFAFDVMGHIVLDHDLECQLGPNELVESFRKLVEWTPEATDVNPFTNLNPTRYAMYFYYRRKMDNYLGRILDARYAHRSTLDRESLRGKRKPGIDLALDEYVRQQQEEGEKVVRGLDPGFRALAIDSMKTFLFAGSDSTSTTITYVFHSLAKHPEAYAKVKAELDAVFGQDITKAADLLREDSSLMNRLGYLNCVVKGKRQTSLLDLMLISTYRSITSLPSSIHGS